MSAAASMSLIRKISVALSVVMAMSGCVSVDLDERLLNAQNEISDLSGSNLTLTLKRTKEEREQADELVAQLLQEPLNSAQAIQVAMANSPAFQAVLAQHWAQMSSVAQSGRIANPIFNFERVTFGNELEIGRLLSFGLLDILTLPLRQSVAKNRLNAAQINLTNDVISEIIEVRTAWVEAISAKQKLSYAKQIFENAEASAELAKRMKEVGNFSFLDQANQQNFYSEAATQVLSTQHIATSARENLIRKLGLNEDQIEQLQLPANLPPLPDEPMSAKTVSEEASQQRLDVRMAQASLNAASTAQGLGVITSLTDVEVGARHNTVFGDGERANADGYEVDISLPLFDWGGAKREAMNAQTLAASNRLQATLQEASSSLREAYSAYRASYDVAKLYQEDILPVQERMAEESVLQYNGMLIGIFELLANTRRQINVVQSAIDANQNYWLADAALKASMMGKPTMVSVAAASTGGSGGEAGH